MNELIPDEDSLFPEADIVIQNSGTALELLIDGFIMLASPFLPTYFNMIELENTVNLYFDWFIYGIV